VPPVKSQLGTVADGSVSAIGDKLVVNDGLRRRFDYYLAGIDERTLPQLVAEIESDLDTHLPSDAAVQAKHILHQYLDLKLALSALKKDPHYQGRDVETARRRQLAVRALRLQFFDAATNKALFGWQDAYDDYALTRLTITQDKTLLTQEKQLKLAELDAHTAPDIIALRQKPVSYLALAKSVKEARANGANDEAVFQMRVDNVGRDVAKRLAALDHKDEAWQRRIADFKKAKSAILANTSIDNANRQAAIKALREALFSVAEQKRLPAYE
jgi:lipase chaperone LimK